MSKSFRFVLILLAGAMLACSLSFGGEKTATPQDSAALDSGGESSGAAPNVTIVSHTDGQQVANNQYVDIIVQTDATTTDFALKANGSIVSIKKMPPEQSGPTQAILSWLPRRTGTYHLEVIAYNGTLASAPVPLTLVVVPGAPAASGQPGAPCMATILVPELNFRSGPGTTAAKLGQFTMGEQVAVIGRNAEGTWYKVRRADGQEVWVINDTDWIRTEGGCDAVTVTG